MKKINFFVIIFLLLLLSGCGKNNQTPPSSKTIDEKYYCETSRDCVDGAYCEKTDDGCVSINWWNKNVGYKYECLPDPNVCLCKNNKCVKK